MARYRETNGGKVLAQVDVASQLHPVIGVVLPINWKQTFYSKTGAVRRTFTVVVRSATATETAPTSEFDLEFPPGMEVDDQRTGKSYVVDPSGSLAGLRGPGGPVEQERTRWLWWAIFPVALAVGIAIRRWRHRLGRKAAPTTVA